MSRDYTAPPPRLRDVLTGEQACDGAGGLFFNDPDAPKETEAGRIAAAKSLCLGDGDTRPACAVLEECRHYALHRETSGGVWGGMSYKQIKAMRRELGITAEPPMRMDSLFAATPEERAKSEARRWQDRRDPEKELERNREYRARVASRRREVVDVELPEPVEPAIEQENERGDEGWCAA